MILLCRKNLVRNRKIKLNRLLISHYSKLNNSRQILYDVAMFDTIMDNSKIIYHCFFFQFEVIKDTQHLFSRNLRQKNGRWTTRGYCLVEKIDDRSVITQCFLWILLWDCFFFNYTGWPIWKCHFCSGSYAECMRFLEWY